MSEMQVAPGRTLLTYKFYTVTLFNLLDKGKIGMG